MKNLTIISAMGILLLLGICSSTAQTKFIEPKSVAELVNKAKAEKKLVFIDVYATWCGPCKRLAADVFPDPSVGDYMNETFVNGKFDAEVGEGINVAKKYNVNAYPTLLILNSNGQEIARMVGAPLKPADFLEAIQAKIN